MHFKPLAPSIRTDKFDELKITTNDVTVAGAVLSACVVSVVLSPKIE